jgi:hypothetical protein
MTRKHSGWILSLVGLSLMAFSGCSKTGESMTSWRPKFLFGSAPAPKGPNGETFITSENDLPPPKFSVQQGEGVTPVENSGGSILDQAPPPGTYAPGYVPVIQKVPFTELPPTDGAASN